jgi:L-ascorbate metabolism protein UlaG (beta-lactamase superfamily)
LSLSGAKIYTVKQVADELTKYGLKTEPIPKNIGPFSLDVIPVKHEGILDSPLPEMAALIIDGKVLHPVDSLEDKLLAYIGIELLVLPVMAPFTTELIVAAFADKIQPKQILPVHDGFAKPFFLKQRYKNYKQHFEKQGVIFHDTMGEIGASVEV